MTGDREREATAIEDQQRAEETYLRTYLPVADKLESIARRMRGMLTAVVERDADPINVDHLLDEVGDCQLKLEAAAKGPRVFEVETWR